MSKTKNAKNPEKMIRKDSIILFSITGKTENRVNKKVNEKYYGFYQNIKSELEYYKKKLEYIKKINTKPC